MYKYKYQNILRSFNYFLYYVQSEAKQWIHHNVRCIHRSTYNVYIVYYDGYIVVDTKSSYNEYIAINSNTSFCFVKQTIVKSIAWLCFVVQKVVFALA